jgi:hypothetical protein
MSLEAIAAMLGHRSMDMTLRYAKIANRTVADEHFAVSDQVDVLYAQAAPLPAEAIGPNTARLRREHHRHLGRGYCTRPPELDCAFESICETCTFSQSSIEFRPTLKAQHDDAAAKGHVHRAALFGQLLTKPERQGIMNSRVSDPRGDPEERGGVPEAPFGLPPPHHPGYRRRCRCRTRHFIAADLVCLLGDGALHLSNVDSVLEAGDRQTVP